MSVLICALFCSLGLSIFIVELAHCTWFSLFDIIWTRSNRFCYSLFFIFFNFRIIWVYLMTWASIVKYLQCELNMCCCVYICGHNNSLCDDNDFDALLSLFVFFLSLLFIAPFYLNLLRFFFPVFFPLFDFVLYFINFSYTYWELGLLRIFFLLTARDSQRKIVLKKRWKQNKRLHQLTIPRKRNYIKLCTYISWRVCGRVYWCTNYEQATNFIWKWQRKRTVQREKITTIEKKKQ